MDKLMWVLILAAIIFVLSYDPKSGTLNKFVELNRPRPQEEKKLCCGSNDYRSVNSDQCDSAYFQNLQFAGDTVACPVNKINSWKGAIFGPGPAVIGM